MGANNSKSSGAKGGKKVTGEKAERVLLDKRVVPTLYELVLETNNKGSFRFEGNVKISLKLAEAGITSISLHAKELHLEKCTFTAAGSENQIGIKNLSYDRTWNTVTMEFAEALPEGQGILEISYLGLHNDQMAGFYRSTYKDREGNDAVMLSTQFEALEARRCFPCVDEPGAKAVFKPTLVIDDGLSALSNMPEESNTLLDDGQRRKVVFGETPLMSTYLLAFCVADLDYLERTSKNGVLIRVYTPPGRKDQGQFALDVAVDALDLYDEMFKQPYPLPKLDMVAIPAFAMGAMENWGLITYREVDLLIDSVRASSQQKQRVAVVVAHELAHQWFGNLVTMEWWSGLWLNEGFASWMMSYCTDVLFPEWSMWEQFVIADQGGAMRLDALVSSHPIEVPIKHAEEVEAVFDAISYFKGASVVRLIYSFLGGDFFKQGLQLYMDRFKYKNTETTDLWQAWEDVSKLPVKKVMASWTSQMGFPVVTVKSAAWNEDCSSCTVKLEQSWFIADGSKHPDTKKKLWSIPLMVTMGGNDGELVNLGIMDTRTTEVVIPVKAKRKTWIKFNGEQHVPMRVNYDPVAEDFAPLFAEAISTKEMVTTDRAGILLDSYALTKSGAINAGSLIKLLGAYENEDTMPVFKAMEDVLGTLHKLLRNDPELDTAFTKFGARLISKTSKEIGWDKQSKEGHLTTLLRTILIRLQALFMPEDPEVQKNAKKRFEAWAADPVNNHDELPSDIKTDVIKIVLAVGEDDTMYNKCLELIDLAETDQDKKEIYLAIGAAKSQALKKRTLDWCTSGALKTQDFFYPIGSVSSSSQAGLEMCWSYLQDNYPRLVDMIRTASPSLLFALVTSSCGSFASTERAEEIQEFFRVNNEHPVPLISQKLDQMVENIQANAKFLATIQESESFKTALQEPTA
eukprot:CAMPEP_0184519588 /NCGR_PEP_ID=MMETSP0198_2-20121128/6710_1 /TAXON_ID=1112570 /ORGANISM="Thraustochytrium sp., Strain LLF1b" /LENGTH=912 /DNA_ID=CAMNT_0026910121 /DNA_START=34 /DNA_END=2771 /DNA_ORIENTATION=+